jgi:hypothetical protein
MSIVRTRARDYKFAGSGANDDKAPVSGENQLATTGINRSARQSLPIK